MRRLVAVLTALAVACLMASTALASSYWPHAYVGCQNYKQPGGYYLPSPRVEPGSCEFVGKIPSHGGRVRFNDDLAYVDQMHWRDWGSSVAHGTGRLSVASMSRGAYTIPATITLSDLVHVHNDDCASSTLTYYARERVSWHHYGLFPGAENGFTFRNEPEFEC